MSPSQGETLAQRLRALRERRFAGRAAELELWRSALDADRPEVALFFLHGPGGIGKTSLLERFADAARRTGRPTTMVDGRALTPTPDGFARAVDRQPAEEIAPVLIIDTYERLSALDDWLRDVYLPGLPARSLVAIGGRRSPRPAWRTDPGWAPLLHEIALGGLCEADARALLDGRGVGPADQAHILAFAGGHPLALTLMADVELQGGTQHGKAGVDVIRTLVERFLDGTPDRVHREALGVCALARVTTESLLRRVMPGGPSAELFDWLCGLSFVELTPDGAMPHDLARKALDAELRWRDHEAHSDLRGRILAAQRGRARELTGRERDRVYLDMLHQQRFNPIMRRFFNWRMADETWLEPLNSDHHEELRVIADRAGPDTRALTERWLSLAPHAFDVFRRGDESGALGFALQPLFSTPLADAGGDDPGVLAIATHIERHGPLRDGEQVSVTRLWVERDGGQSVDTHHLVATRATAMWADTTRLAWTFAIVSDPDFWAPMFHATGLARARDADHAFDGRRHGVFAIDWRRLPYDRWLAGERDLGDRDPPPLTRAQFDDAVRAALRAYTRTAELERNPLLTSRALGTAPDSEAPVERLRSLLHAETEALRGHPRDEKLHAALEATYLAPAPTQELAARRLGLPFSTYRRHLGAGIARVTERLWDREIGRL